MLSQATTARAAFKSGFRAQRVAIPLEIELMAVAHRYSKICNGDINYFEPLSTAIDQAILAKEPAVNRAVSIAMGEAYGEDAMEESLLSRKLSMRVTGRSVFAGPPLPLP